MTLTSKLGSAFWDAFARPSPTGASGVLVAGAGAGRREWDADKVRRVMEGSAVLKVVDVEPQEKAASRPAQPVHTRASPVPMTASCAHITDVLAESMATLSIGKK